MNSSAFLLFNNEDYNKYYKIFSLKSELVFMERFSSISFSPKIKHKIFHDFLNTNEKEPEINFLANNWYRNYNSIDTFDENNISLPKSFTGSFLIKFANLYRDYHCMKKLFERYSKVYIPSNLNKYHLNLINSFNFEIITYQSKDSNLLSCSFIGRTLTIPKFSFLNKVYGHLFYLIDLVLIKFNFKTNKDLYFSDWTYLLMDMQNNNKFFFGKLSFNIFNYTTNFIPLNKFFKSSKALLNDFNFNKENTPFLYDYKDWDSKLLELIRLNVSKLINDNLNYFNYHLSYYTFFLKLYKPASITVPADSYELYAIIMMVCKKLSIKVNFLSDSTGIYNLSAQLNLKNKNNKSYLFDNIYSFSNQSKLNFTRLGYPENQIKKIDHPIFDYHKAKNQIITEEIIILIYTPYDLNPISSIGVSELILYDLVKTCVDLKFNKIHIKFKSKYQINDFTEVFNKFADINFVFEYRPLWKLLSLKKFNFVIGQAGSSLSEFMFLKSNFLIYEPVVNGLTDFMLEPLKNLKGIYLSRNLDSLKKNINNLKQKN